MFQAISFILHKTSCVKLVALKQFLQCGGHLSPSSFEMLRKVHILTDSVIPHLYRINCAFFKEGPFSKEILQHFLSLRSSVTLHCCNNMNIEDVLLWDLTLGSK